MFLLNRVEFTAKILVNEFTSHYVPIKSSVIYSPRFRYPDLHPIMFLLNLLQAMQSSDLLSYLHPIMFLLNRDLSCACYSHTTIFTSHYVPIKSLQRVTTIVTKVIHLHPIMFLLNPIPI